MSLTDEERENLHILDESDSGRDLDEDREPDEEDDSWDDDGPSDEYPEEPERPEFSHDMGLCIRNQTIPYCVRHQKTLNNILFVDLEAYACDRNCGPCIYYMPRPVNSFEGEI